MSYLHKSGSKPSSLKPSLALIALLLLVAGPRLCAMPQAAPQPSGKAHAVEDSNSSARNGSRVTMELAPEETSEENKLGLQTIKNIVRDQRQIWTSPARVRLGHADWLVPYAGLTAGFLVTDRDASLHLSNSPGTLKHYRDFSNYGLVAGMFSSARCRDIRLRRAHFFTARRSALDLLAIWNSDSAALSSSEALDCLSRSTV